MGQLIAAVRGVQNPGAAPSLASIMPTAVSQVANPLVLSGRRGRFYRLVAAIICAAVGVVVMRASTPGPILGAMAFIASAIFAFRSPALDKKTRQEASAAELAWRESERTFGVAAGNALFTKMSQDAERLIQRLQSLPGEEARRLSELQARRMENQLHRYLEGHTIERAKIRGVGESRKLTLRSYGIETAADVDRARIERIHGFGEALTADLIGWRKVVESRFRFNPAQGVNPLDVNAVKSDIAKQSSDAELRLRQVTVGLQKASSDALAFRANPGSAVLATWTSWRMAETNLQALKFRAGEKGQLIALAGFAGFTLLLSGQLSRVPLKASRPPAVVSTPVKPVVTPPVASVSKPAPNVADRVQTWLSTTTLPPTIVPPELAAPVDVAASPTPQAAEAEVVFDLDDRPTASRIQERLKALGYFSGAVDGLWGPRSRSALREYRQARQLGNDDKWDMATQIALMSDQAMTSADGTMQQVGHPTFIGKWANSPEQCGANMVSSQIVIGPRKAESLGGACDFVEINGSWGRWRILARCVANGDRWTANVRITLKGAQLEWASERGTEKYYRCG